MAESKLDSLARYAMIVLLRVTAVALVSVCLWERNVRDDENFQRPVREVG